MSKLLELRTNNIEVSIRVECTDILNDQEKIGSIFGQLKDRLPATESVGEQAIVFKNENTNFYFFITDSSLTFMSFNIKDYSKCKELITYCCSVITQHVEVEKVEDLSVKLKCFCEVGEDVNPAKLFDNLKFKALSNLDDGLSLRHLGFEFLAEDCEISMGVYPVENEEKGMMFNGSCSTENFEVQSVIKYVELLEGSLADKGEKILEAI